MMIDRSSFLFAHMSTDCVLSTHLPDIRWLTGFTGSAATVVLSRKDRSVRLFVDGRYTEQAESEIGNARMAVEVRRVSSSTDLTAQIADCVGGASVAVDDRHVTHAQWSTWSGLFPIVASRSVIEEARRVKDDHELSCMSRAAEIASNALLTVVADGLCGRTERQVQRRLDALLFDGGADDVAFPTIVATGVAGALPHHRPGDDEIRDGDLVVIDMGAMVGGYRSDMTRTVRVGHISGELESMYETVREAQRRASETVIAGVKGRDVDAAARAVFDAAGVTHEFVHGTGHGVGLEIHENPILGPACETSLLNGEVVTVEPGLYRRGVGGVRIEDLVVVTGGTCRNLSLTDKELSCPRSARMI